MTVWFPACPDPVSSAIASLQEQFKQIDKDMDQILTGTPAKAVGSLRFCEGLLPPFNWGTVPVTGVTVSPEGVVTVTPPVIDETKSISIGGVTIRPYYDFAPQDPKSGTFGKIANIFGVHHFYSRKLITGQFAITADTRSFNYSSYTSFSSADVGRWIYNSFAANPGNIGFFQITEVLSNNEVVCGGATTLVDEYALSLSELVERNFTPDDASNGRLLNIAGTNPTDNGQFLITSYVNDNEVIYTDLGAPTTPIDFNGNCTWSVSYNIHELLLMIATARPFAYHPQVALSVSDPYTNIEAKSEGSAGNSISITLGSGLSFICPSGSTLIGGKDGNLLADIATANSAIADVYTTTDAVLALGGTDSASVSFQQNAIPPNASNLSDRLYSCGFPTVNGNPVAHGDPRMKGYAEFIELCGIELLRNFLSTGNPGDRYYVAIDLVTDFIPTPESCGTSMQDEAREVPMCGIGPNGAPTAVRYYVFHHTSVQTSSASINSLFDDGFSAEQVSTIMNPNGGIGNGVISIVLSYTNAIEEALFNGYTIEDILSVLNKGIEDWKYDATPADLREVVSSLRSKSISSPTSQSCFLRYWGGIKGDRLSGADDSLKNMKVGICTITSLALKAAVEFALKQIGKVNKTIAKVNDVTASLSSALSFSNFVNSTLADFPSNPTLRCLLGSINMNAIDPAAAIGGALGSAPTDMISNFASIVNPQINFGAEAAKATLDRANLVLNAASKSVYLLQYTVSSMTSEAFGSAAVNSLVNCASSGLDLSLPKCALDSLAEVSSLLTSLQASIDFSLSIAANLEAAMSKMTKLNIANVSGPNQKCPDGNVASLVNALKSPLSL